MLGSMGPGRVQTYFPVWVNSLMPLNPTFLICNRHDHTSEDGGGKEVCAYIVPVQKQFFPVPSSLRIPLFSPVSLEKGHL